MVRPRPRLRAATTYSRGSARDEVLPLHVSVLLADLLAVSGLLRDLLITPSATVLLRVLDVMREAAAETTTMTGLVSAGTGVGGGVTLLEGTVQSVGVSIGVSIEVSIEVTVGIEGTEASQLEISPQLGTGLQCILLVWDVEILLQGHLLELQEC